MVHKKDSPFVQEFLYEELPPIEMINSIKKEKKKDENRGFEIINILSNDEEE